MTPRACGTRGVMNAAATHLPDLDEKVTLHHAATTHGKTLYNSPESYNQKVAEGP